jgi:hypothetical protein
MKKIFYVLISLILSASLVNSAKADTSVVMGLGGPQVVTNSAPPANNGPTIGGGVIHDSPMMASVPMAVVNPENDMVTNVIMCEPSQCKSGAFAGSRDFYVPQITPDNTGIWGGPGTTKYDFNTQTFTIEYSAVETEESVLNPDGTVTKIMVISPSRKFIYQNFIDNYNAVSSTQRIFPTENNIIKDITAINNTIVQNLIITKSNDINETELAIRDSNLTLLIDNIETVLELIGDWSK